MVCLRLMSYLPFTGQTVNRVNVWFVCVLCLICLSLDKAMNLLTHSSCKNKIYIAYYILILSVLEAGLPIKML